MLKDRDGDLLGVSVGNDIGCEVGLQLEIFVGCRLGNWLELWVGISVVVDDMKIVGELEMIEGIPVVIVGVIVGVKVEIISALLEGEYESGYKVGI
jgi:hypothetical protein